MNSMSSVLHAFSHAATGLWTAPSKLAKRSARAQREMQRERERELLAPEPFGLVKLSQDPAEAK